MTLLIQFFLAHIIGDFFVQPGSWVRDKERNKLASVYLYIHVVIHFLLLLLLTAGRWRQAGIIAVLHLLIDGAKLVIQKHNNRRRWFFIDQLLHLLVLVAVWAFTMHMNVDWTLLQNRNLLATVTGFLFLLTPTSFIIKTVISKWQPASITTFTGGSLENAGQLIGMIERLMVMTFILLGKWEGVGFMLAAKSVFRFGDLKEAKDMKLTEYVLIGTFLSFGLAIITGLITNLLLQ
jgi:hypothetical protein